MKLPVLLALVACLTLGVIAASQGVAQNDDVAAYMERGQELSKAGHPEQALPYFLLALEVAEVRQGTDDPALLPILDALAGAHTQAGFYRDAEPVYERALLIQEREATRNQTGIVRTLNKLGQIYEATDRASEAMALYRRVLTTWAPILGGEHPDVRIAGGRLAKLALQAPTAAATPSPTPAPAPEPRPAPALKDLLQDKPKDTTVAAVPPAPPKPEAKPEPKLEPKLEPKAAQPPAPPPAPAKPAPQAAPAPTPEPAATPPQVAAAPPAQPTPSRLAEPAPSQPAEPAPPQAAARDGPGYAVHLTSIRNPDDAQAEWNRLRRLYGHLLSDLDLRVARADLGAPRGVYYRIKGGTLGAEGAKERCAAFLASGVWCDVTRDETGAAPAQVAADGVAANGAAALPQADSGEGGYLIHLTSIRKAEDAAAEWQRLKRVYGRLLDGLELKVKRADLGPAKGVYYRIEAGPLDRGQARELCGQFAARKVWCRVVRPGEEASEGPLRYALQRVRRRPPSRDRGPGRLRSGILMRTRWRDRGCRRSPFAAFMR